MLGAIAATPIRRQSGTSEMRTSRIVIGAGAILVLATSTAASAADCVRHFYNDSRDSWMITLHNNSGTCSVANAVEQSQCVIPAGQVALLTYNLPGKHQNAYIWVGTDGAVTHSSYDHSYDLEADTDGKCIYIKHSGSTGRASLNDGRGSNASGDITTKDQ